MKKPTTSIQVCVQCESPLRTPLLAIEVQVVFSIVGQAPVLCVCSGYSLLDIMQLTHHPEKTRAREELIFSLGPDHFISHFLYCGCIKFYPCGIILLALLPTALIPTVYFSCTSFVIQPAIFYQACGSSRVTVSKTAISEILNHFCSVQKTLYSLQISSLLDMHFCATITQRAHERHVLLHSGKQQFKTAVATVAQWRTLKVQCEQCLKFSVFEKIEKEDWESPYKRHARCETFRSFSESFESRDFSLSSSALKCWDSSPLPLSRWLHTP